MTADAAPGVVTVVLGPGRRVGPASAPGADLTLVVLEGELLLHRTAAGAGAPAPLPAGREVTVPRGTEWALVAGPAGVRVRVVAVPPGPEQFLALAAREPALPLGTLVAVAPEQGISLRAGPSDAPAGG
jgi:hypothetical protein